MKHRRSVSIRLRGITSRQKYNFTREVDLGSVASLLGGELVR